MLLAGQAYALKSFPGDQQPSRICEYNPGQYFGELALLTNEPRAASIVTTTACKFLTLGRSHFDRLLGCKELFMQRVDQYKSKPKSAMPEMRVQPKLIRTADIKQNQRDSASMSTVLYNLGSMAVDGVSSLFNLQSPAKETQQTQK